MTDPNSNSLTSSTSKKYHVSSLTQEDVPQGCCCISESTFATLFPSYLEKYISESWPAVETILAQHKLVGKLNLMEGSMTVATTRQTWDPYSIIQARDFIKLLARNVPLMQSQRIFQDDVICEIIPISIKGKSTRRFVKRRDRLIGPQGQTLKALEILTGCYVMVQGKTVSVIGSLRGCQQVKHLVEECMRNIHPVYGLKQLLIKRELSKREDLKHEDWSRFIPVYKKSNQSKETQKQIKKIKKERVKQYLEKQKVKERSVFPPQQLPRKEDLALESGEAFLSNSYRKKTKKQDPV